MNASSKRVSPVRSEPETELFSIGQVAEATGLSEDVLRVWERRYGRPRARRLPSGHRRYTAEQLRWLRQVAEALALGCRASEALKLEDSELSRWLVDHRPGGLIDREIHGALALATEYRSEELKRSLQSWRDQLGPIAFLSHALGPFVHELGRAWEDGRLGIRHEHFVSQVIEDFLRRLRGDSNVDRTAPWVVLATLPGERHGIGLQIAALCCTHGGLNVQLLGVDTPTAEIVRAVSEAGALGVGVSISLAKAGAFTKRRVVTLRRELPATVRLGVGGQGGRRVCEGVKGAEYLQDLPALTRWVGELASARGERQGGRGHAGA